MLILTIRTDKPEAEIGLYQDMRQLDYTTWLAHRKLAETLHTTIRELLANQKLDWHDIQAIACYRGPGSFTGLRIGLTVANALADSLGVPIAAETGEAWLQNALTRLLHRESDIVAVPEYGAEAHITLPKSLYPASSGHQDGVKR